jgi:hypothetical protein
VSNRFTSNLTPYAGLLPFPLAEGWGGGSNMHKEAPTERYAFDLRRKRERFKIHGNIAG